MLASAADVAWGGAPRVSIRPTARAGDFHKRAVKGADALIAAARLGGKVAFVVADAKTGLILEAANPVLPQPPACVTKTITSLYALDTLGAGFRFKTRLMATGPVVNGRLKGDLVLVGGGDPTLDTDDLADMAAALKQAGVHEVSGKFKVNSSALPFIKQIDKSQPDYLGYNPAVCGLNLNFNRVHFEWKRSASGYDVAMDARTKKYRPSVRIAKMRVVDRDLPIYTYKDSGGVDNWTVARRALGRNGSRWLPVRKPHLYAAEVFQTMARSQGISLPRAVEAKGATKGTVLVEHKSDELQVLLKALLKFSNNMTAEAIGMTASAARGGTGGSLKASAKKMTDWTVSHTGARKSKFVDHSGLGTGSRLTAGDMVSALVRQGPNGSLAHLLKPIALRDANGRVIKEHPIKVHAKTGTLNFVSNLAGYVTAPDGTQLAFAMFMADERRRAGVAKSDREAPQGAKSWNKAAKRLQQALIERWATLYGT
ncbi:D-alanyl-D-alanine carboxypeptidase/D-alanyl-D-alanine endopeptidase [Profundibacter sp.]|uniref:D-alanyl-D-alanine carboxypeptidase/D-alanyl-D-alanine endopeptidase n=1 Tax=Profundibacter sp. TaxID=3101071 RepID=UPI003D133134